MTGKVYFDCVQSEVAVRLVGRNAVQAAGRGSPQKSGLGFKVGEFNVVICMHEAEEVT